jgi:ATP-binding cassette subfamily F protein 3
LSKVNQAIRKDIQQDDKMLASNYDKHRRLSFTAYNKKKPVRQAIVRLGGCSRRN